MAWSLEDMPELGGRVAVVTGANDGLGLETARAFAGAGAHVVMATRNQEKAESARRAILETHPQASLEVVELDLGSQASVKAAASSIVERHPTVDILINNAGLMAMPETRTVDGFEMQFGVNHLGHWTFTAGLMSAILAAPAGRVVTVTSTAHHFGTQVDPDDVNMEGSYSPWGAYGRSKLANYHFAIGLQREFEKIGSSAISLVAHPGLSHTNLQARTVEEGGGGSAGEFWHSLVQKVGMDASRGALPQIRAATDPRAKGGEMYAPRFVNFGPPVRRPVLRQIGLGSAIANLWRVSERETGVALDLRDQRQPV